MKTSTQIFFGHDGDTDFIYRREVAAEPKANQNNNAVILGERLEELKNFIFEASGGWTTGYGYDESDKAFEAPANMILIAETLGAFRAPQEWFMDAQGTTLVILEGTVHGGFNRRQVEINPEIALEVLEYLQDPALPVSGAAAPTPTIYLGVGPLPVFSATYRVHRKTLAEIAAAL